MRLPTPAQIKTEYPVQNPDQIALLRREAIEILEGKDTRLALMIGPCSVHDVEAVYEYACKLKMLELDPIFFPIIRLFIEKPRTKLGWKGLLYDPDLDGSYDIAKGIRKSRELILKIAELGLPCATEILEPIAISYFEDLIVWGIIGARTSASQPHRQVASGLSFPVGFKNDLNGKLDVAISGILTSRTPHSHIGIDDEGYISSIQTSGNPHTHLVLRGSDLGPNYEPIHVESALQHLSAFSLEKRLIIDCSHGNCNKNPLLQREVFQSVIEQTIKTEAIRGLMLESHLFMGNQPLQKNLSYGVSITDPCLGWEETQDLLRSMSLTQN